MALTPGRVTCHFSEGMVMFSWKDLLVAAVCLVLYMAALTFSHCQCHAGKHEEAKAAWAFAVATNGEIVSPTPTPPKPEPKVSPCSELCTCGCNEGGICLCDQNTPTPSILVRKISSTESQGRGCPACEAESTVPSSAQREIFSNATTWGQYVTVPTVRFQQLPLRVVTYQAPMPVTSQWIHTLQSPRYQPFPQKAVAGPQMTYQKTPLFRVASPTNCGPSG